VRITGTAAQSQEGLIQMKQEGKESLGGRGGGGGTRLTAVHPGRIQKGLLGVLGPTLLISPKSSQPALTFWPPSLTGLCQLQVWPHCERGNRFQSHSWGPSVNYSSSWRCERCISMVTMKFFMRFARHLTGTSGLLN
jgi:hypothetical protein